jgi:lipopolysaccharide export system permease protein
MLQNKIYQNYIKEILKTFLVILFGLTIIAWTVRAVNFLDLIVDSGYSITTYFQYSLLNLFGIFTKFIPLSFLIALIIFIIKQMQENEFVILWTSGVKKIKLVNLFFVISILILFFYLIFSTFVTPSALNLSRNLLSKNNFNSFLPTIRVQQFSDSFKGFTFLVEEKINNEIKNVFIYDSSNTLKNLNTTSQSKKSTTIVAEKGLVEEKRMILFNGQIITSEKEKLENSIIKFQQLNLDLKDLQTDTIKVPKLQETPTSDLVKCILKKNKRKILNCEEHTKKEIITVLNRRIVLPFYIPIISLLCSFLLIKNETKKNYFSNKFSIFFISFLILLYSELIIRYTGIYKIISILFFISPLVLIPIIYTLLNFKLSKPSLTK